MFKFWKKPEMIRQYLHIDFDLLRLPAARNDAIAVLRSISFLHRSIDNPERERLLEMKDAIKLSAGNGSMVE